VLIGIGLVLLIAWAFTCLVIWNVGPGQSTNPHSHPESANTFYVLSGSGEYVRGDVYTNNAENYFSILKRGVIGTFHHISNQHLPMYLAEFDFRQNHRVKLGYSDDMRTDKALEGIKGKRLTYRVARSNPFAAQTA
jgi:hypothetical protein